MYLLNKQFLLTAGLLLTLTACGGSGGGSETNTPTSPPQLRQYPRPLMSLTVRLWVAALAQMARLPLKWVMVHTLSPLS